MPVFELEQVRFRGVLDIPALRIETGITAVTGPSGAGKSTLLRLLDDLREPDSGTIRHRGTDIREIPAIELRRRVPMLSQSPVVVPGTVLDNLARAHRLQERPDPAPDAAAEALAALGLIQDLDADAGVLSGGERQRLALARLLLLTPDTVLLDEPTSALDEDTALRVMGTLVRLLAAGGTDIVFVTHSSALVDACAEHRVVVSGGTARQAAR